MDNVTIVGGGHAAIQCAMKLREYGFLGEVKILTEENHYPYHRPPLSKKFLIGEVSEQDLYIVNPETIAQNNIDIIFLAKVTAVNTVRKQVMCNGEYLPYGHLVIATGAAPRQLNISDQPLNNLYYCRNMDDIEKISSTIQQINDVVIIGGGYIGLELAATLKLMGKNVTVLEKAERILNRVASANTAQFIKDTHTHHGVDILEGIGISQFHIENQLIHSIELDNQTLLNCDAVIAGIGVIPNTQFLDDTFEKVNESLSVNGYCQTNQSDVFAIGDCTIFNLNGVLTKLESVQNANEQADIVAKFIIGTKLIYQPKPWFWSDQYDMKIQIAGLARNYDTVISRVNDSKVSYWYFRKNTLIAVDAINDARSFMIGKKFIGSDAMDLHLIPKKDADLTKNFH